MGTTVRNWKKELMKTPNFSKIQNEFIHDGSRVYIPIAWRKQDNEKLHDVHQGINALKCIVKNAAWGPIMDNDIEHLVRNCNDCNKQQFRLKDSTEKRKECGPPERLHMDRLCEEESGNVIVIADAGSGWLEAFSCTDGSARNVVRCLRTTIFRFGPSHTVVSGIEKVLVSKDSKESLTPQGCYKSDTFLYSPTSNGLVERAVQILNRSLNFSSKYFGYCFGTNMDKVVFSHRNSSNTRGITPAKLLLRRSLWNPIFGFNDDGLKFM